MGGARAARQCVTHLKNRAFSQTTLGVPDSLGLEVLVLPGFWERLASFCATQPTA